jgi:hypothetical protein
MSEKKDFTLDDLKRLIGEFFTKDPVKMVELLAIGSISFEKLNPIIKNPLISFMFGPVSFALATTPNYGGTAGIEFFGTGLQIPMNSETVGLIGLGFLGLASLPWQDLINFVEGVNQANQNILSGRDLLTEVAKYLNGQAPYQNSLGQPFVSSNNPTDIQLLKSQYDALNTIIGNPGAPLLHASAGASPQYQQAYDALANHFNTLVALAGGSGSGGAR